MLLVRKFWYVLLQQRLLALFCEFPLHHVCYAVLVIFGFFVPLLLSLSLRLHCIHGCGRLEKSGEAGGGALGVDRGSLEEQLAGNVIVDDGDVEDEDLTIVISFSEKQGLCAERRHCTKIIFLYAAT